MRLLVVDDDKEIRDLLKLTLQSELFAVDTAEDGEKGSYAARTNEYDLVILDNMLPYKTGLEVCKDIRAAGKTVPILMLSVMAEIDDKVTVLESGADDYLTKPYSHKELMSRIRALLRRTTGGSPTPGMLSSDNLILSPMTQEVTLSGKDIYLTRKEFALLELLLRNKGKIVSRGAIMEHVWDMDGDPLSKTIEMHIVNLRKKIEKGKRKVIVNIPGRGYTIKE